MAESTVVVRKALRTSGSPMPRSGGSGCSLSAPTSYVLQTFGVDISSVESWDAITGMYGSEVMQGLQNFPEIESSVGRPNDAILEEFSEHSYVRISYAGTNYRDTDGNIIFKGTEEHSSIWADEEDSGLIWL